MNSYNGLVKGRYGSFDLQRKVGPNLLKGLLVSLLIHGTVIGTPYLLWLVHHETVEPRDEGTIIILDKPPILIPHQPLNKPIEIAPPALPDIQKTIPVPVDVDAAEDTQLVKSQDDIRRKVIADGKEEGSDSALGGQIVYNIPPPILETIPPVDTFIAYEVQPQPLPDFSPPPNFPDLVAIAGVSGKVIVKMYVDRYGDVKKWIILKVDPAGVGFESEVEKVVPKWRFTPAVQQGHPIGVWVAVPFRFAVKK
jgi:TonB family protein